MAGFKAQKDDTVQVHYTGRLEDGVVFDSSVGANPIEFTLGAEQMIPGFENGVYDMAEGDRKTVEIPAEQAYGFRSEDMIIEVPIEHVPADITPEVGLQLYLQDPEGNPLPVVIVEIAADKIVLDGNHPLAGKALTFDIEVVSIKRPSRIIMP